MTMKLSRRSALRGVLAGSAVTIGMPFLDCFLNTNGTALAATGAPLPLRFGTWFWGLGFTPNRWVPTHGGANYDLLPELKAIEPHKNKISILSGFNVNLDGTPNSAHISGVYSVRTGIAPKTASRAEGPSFDALIAASAGKGTRFQSLELTATGDPKHSYSRPSGDIVNPGEPSPLALYKRIFGPEFRDPNAAEFHPDPGVMLKKSVLSAVLAESRDTLKNMGQADRVRMDQYFTSIRQLEQQLALQLEKPAPAQACSIPPSPADGPIGPDIETMATNHRLLTQLLALALACNQTKIFNMVFSYEQSNAYRSGDSLTHHLTTHEEPVDPVLGYQPKSAWFVERSMKAWADFVGILDGIREGDRTLLDNSFVLAHSETSFAKIHSYAGIPVMIAGSAGGRLKTGLHIMGNGDPITRVGLTAQQMMGVPVNTWGTKSMETSKTLTEIMV
ncbi:MAG: DUF1552 domain-containing protein [Rhodospirillaceae bacterium]